MANCHNLFQIYHNAILIDSNKKKDLIKGRNALRAKIRKYFREEKEGEIAPVFASQGSYKMGTLVTPPKEEDESAEYDLDDGIYFKGKKEERKSVTTYHTWIMNAVDGHTKDIIDKTTCVRVTYAKDYHIDLPIYFFANDSACPQLAHKSKDWIDSDPRAFANWFSNKTDVNGQLKRIIRYLKGWRDYRNSKKSCPKMPSGMILTILGTQNFVENERDDISLFETLKKIQQTLENDYRCFRPTTPTDEDLFAKYSDAQKNYFMEQLKAFCESAGFALEHPIPKDACIEWQKHLGLRFCCDAANEDVEEANQYQRKPRIKANARSANA